MNDEFNSGADTKGLDCEFWFRGNRYFLETYNDAKGNISSMKMDADIPSLALRYAIQEGAEHVSKGFAEGIGLLSQAESFENRDGAALSVLHYKGRTMMASTVMNAAMQILVKEYEPVVFVPKTQEKHKGFTMIVGGLA